jgi:multicomponent Na+:H+ antiporter subunit E
MSMHRTDKRAFLMRLVPAAATWWVLTDGALEWDAWVIGVPAVLATTWLSAALLPATGWSWRGAARFALFFLWESLRGGIDVARRAFDPRMPLAPGFFDHELEVRPDLARVAVINTSSLMPGSLVVDIDGQTLRVHALDLLHPSSPRTVAGAETRIARMFALSAAAASGEGQGDR